MIPKIIHYCWFGGKEMPILAQECLQSWKEKLDGFEIKRWDESNSNLSHPFVQKAYQDKQWAFVSDYVRLEVLNNYGGIYLDTDMLVVKDVSPLLINDCFVGLESERYLSCGVIGSTINHPFIESCLRYYDDNFNKEIVYKEFVIPKIFTKIYKSMYNDLDVLEPKVHHNLHIFPIDYFYPYPNPDPNKKRVKDAYKKHITQKTYMVHLWDRSWKGYNEFNLLRQGAYLKGISKVIKQVVENKNKRNFAYFKKIVSSFKHSFFNEK